MQLRTILFFLLLGTTGISGYAHGHKHEHATTEGFTANEGQFHPNVTFKRILPNGALFIEQSAFTFALYNADVREALHVGEYEGDLNNIPFRFHAYRMEFDGAQSVKPIGHEKLPGHTNYFLGNDAKRWASKVPSYTHLVYPSFYTGIDLHVENDATGNVKYEFHLEAGTSPKAIAWHYEGVDEVTIKHGELIVQTSLGSMIEARPYAYQLIDGKEKQVSCRYELDDGTVRFVFPDGYDSSLPLVIDPTLIFSTYSGSSANNFGYTATFDARGYLYSGSTAFGIGYPTSLGAYQSTWAGGTGGSLVGIPALVGTDIVITKWDTNGTQPIYSTYLGGSSDELPHSLVVNELQELYVMGTTSSLDYPTTPFAFDTSFNINPSSITVVNLLSGLGAYFPNGSDIVISRFDSTGNSLSSSTFLGGTHNDGLNTGTTKFNYADEVRGEILIGDQQSVYIATCSHSNDNPTGVFPSFQNTKTSAAGNQDGILYKLSFDLSTLGWMAYLGGTVAGDAIYSIALDNNDDIYVSGGTSSNDFPVTAGSFDPSFNGDRDGFVAHITSTGDSLMRSTFIGSANYDQSYFVETDSRDFVYLFGQTSAPNGQLITNAQYNDPLGGQFVSKLWPQLDTLVWSTRFGTGDGNPDISPTAFLVDLCSAVYLSGWGSNIQGGGLTTTGLDTAGLPFQGTTDGNDFYLAVLADDASALNYGSFFGGSAAEHVDGGTSRFDKKGKIYQAVCAGCGGTSDFPTLPNPGAHSNTNGASASSGCNLAVFKMDFLLPVVVADFLSPSDGCTPFTVDFENVSLQQSATSFWWDFGNGDTSTLFEPSYTYTSPGVYNVRLVVSDTASCNLADTLTKTITVTNDTTYNIPDARICTGIPTKIGLIGTQPGPGVTFTWDPAVFLSNPALPDPVASPPSDTTYRLYVFNGICTDTIVQQVRLDSVRLLPPPDTVICSQDVPFTMSANGFGSADTFIWSSQPNFTDTLNFPTSDSNVTVFPMGNFTTYYIRAISAQGCETDASVTIGLNDLQNPLQASFSNPGTGCAPVTIAFSNTTNLQQNIRFEWDFGTGDTSLAFNPTYTFNQSGTYRVRLLATDTSACAQVDSFNLDITIDADSNYTLDILACLNQETQVGVDPSNYPNGTFTWMPAGAVNNPNAANPSGIFTQDTTLLLIAQETCLDSITNQITVEPIFAQAPPERITCSDQLPIQLGGTSFGSGQQFVWSSNPNLSDTLNSGNDSLLLTSPIQGSTNYYFQTVSQNGCIEIDTTLVLISDRLLTINGDLFICREDTAILTAQNLYPANALSYDWAPVASIIGPNDGPVIQANPIVPTAYTLTTVNDSGCVREDTILVSVSELDATLVLAEAADDTIIRGLSTELIGFPDNMVFSFVWSPNVGLETPSERITRAQPLETTTYTLVVQDPLNPDCQYLDQKTVHVVEIICGDPEIFVPNAFTPDGDGLNDEVFVRGRNLTELEFSIYNRWGELVFQTRNQQQGWDGRHNGSDADPAVYVYQLDAVCVDGQTYFHKGNLTLIR